MIAETTDIKFECSQCGQPLAIERSGAGLTANCPICENPVTVPRESIRRRGDFGELARMRESGFVHSVQTGGVHPSGIDSSLHEMREELVNAAMENGCLEGDLHGARQDNSRLQQQLRKAQDECERAMANSTHAQAEFKSFHTDRHQLKADLAQSRQRAAAAEAAALESRMEISDLAAAVAAASAENATLRQRMERQSEEDRIYRSSVESQLAARDAMLEGANARAEEVIQALAVSQEELALLRQVRTRLHEELDQAAETRDQLAAIEENLRAEMERGEIAQARIATLDESLRFEAEQAGAAEARLAATEERLRAETHRTEAAEAHSEALRASSDALRKEIDDLRRNLDGTVAGHELLELRARLKELEDEHSRTTAALLDREARTADLGASVEQLTADLHEARVLFEDAERRAEAAAEGKLLKDNDLLRGIIERQNKSLGAQHRELRMLRCGRFGLRLSYVLFGTALLVLVIFALAILKPELVAF